MLSLRSSIYLKHQLDKPLEDEEPENLQDPQEPEYHKEDFQDPEHQQDFQADLDQEVEEREP